MTTTKKKQKNRNSGNTRNKHANKRTVNEERTERGRFFVPRSGPDLQGVALLVLQQAIGGLPFAGSCFACVLHQSIGELPFAGSCFACVLHQALGELPFAALFCLCVASSY